MNLRFFVTAWFAGLPGIVVVTLFVLPTLVAGQPLPVPLWAVQLVSAAQSAVLLAVAVAVGGVLAPQVALVAPVLSAFAEGRRVFVVLRPQLVPGLLGGIVGATLLLLFSRYAPEALVQIQATVQVPAVVKLLYGGVTEELLLRWGFMTLLVWLYWRIWQGGAGIPSVAGMSLAIGVSAIIFGVGHLPAASALLGYMSVSLAAYIVVANAAFGIVAGLLYWRFGLESAILAHTVAHALSLLAPLLGA